MYFRWWECRKTICQQSDFSIIFTLYHSHNSYAYKSYVNWPLLCNALWYKPKILTQDNSIFTYKIAKRWNSKLNSCNMGTSGLPDMSTQCPRAARGNASKNNFWTHKFNALKWYVPGVLFMSTKPAKTNTSKATYSRNIAKSILLTYNSCKSIRMQVHWNFKKKLLYWHDGGWQSLPLVACVWSVMMHLM